MATVVTIGRNVGDSLDARPMDTAAWMSFKEEVRIAVYAVLGDPYFIGSGDGWSEEWGYEDAFTIVAASPFGHAEEEKLVEELEKVRRYYGQEAVAVTIGTTKFV